MASVTDHQYEVTCPCGNRWRAMFDVEPDFVECTACGADAFDLSDLGSLGADDWRDQQA